jgi:hypothetical protein
VARVERGGEGAPNQYAGHEDDGAIRGCRRFLTDGIFLVKRWPSRKRGDGSRMTGTAAQPDAHDRSTCPRCTERVVCIASVAASTGVPVATVEWIAGAFNFIALYQRKAAITHHVDAAELCRMLLADFGQRDPARLREALKAGGIRSSRDIGRIVYAMVGAGLCAADESDSEGDFAGLFESDDLAAYLDRNDLGDGRDWPVAIKRALVLGCCVGGAVVSIAASQRAEWAHGIWLGSALLGAGWLLYRWRGPRPRRFGMAWSTLERRRAP